MFRAFCVSLLLDTDLFHIWHLRPVFTKWKNGLTARSHEVSNQRDSSLNFSNRSEIWQAPRQHYCRDACQISERYDHYNIQSRGFEISWDLAMGRLTALVTRFSSPGQSHNCLSASEATRTKSCNYTKKKHSKIYFIGYTVDNIQFALQYAPPLKQSRTTRLIDRTCHSRDAEARTGSQTIALLSILIMNLSIPTETQHSTTGN